MKQKSKEKNIINQITNIHGGNNIDDRGKITFVNDFDIVKCEIRRFYQIEPHGISSIYAFHGHVEEKKYVNVIKGSIKLICITMDKKTKRLFKNKARECLVYTVILSSLDPKILVIPEGYANGFKALEEGTIVQFFSTSTLKESLEDDYRFPWNVLGEDVWNVKNR